MSSADNLDILSGSRPFDTLIVYLKQLKKKVKFEKSQQTRSTTKHEKLPTMHIVKCIVLDRARCNFSMKLLNDELL